MMVRRYQPGVVFAEDYVRSKLAAEIGCSGLMITGKGSRPDLTQSINALYARFAAQGMNVREDAGEVWFSCAHNSQPWKGYYLVTTQISASAGGGVWHAEHVLGYAAASGKTAIAEAAMLHLAVSMQLNPEWVKMQQGVTMATAQIVAKTNEEISSTVRKRFREQVEDRGRSLSPRYQRAPWRHGRARSGDRRVLDGAKRKQPLLAQARLGRDRGHRGLRFTWRRLRTLAGPALDWERYLARRDGRVAEGARLESVFRGNSNQGSNPCLSAIISFLESTLVQKA